MPTNKNIIGAMVVDKDGNKQQLLNLSNARRMTYQQYQELTPEQEKGVIIVPDAPDADLDASQITYDETTVENALDSKVNKNGDTMTGTLEINAPSASDFNLGKANTSTGRFFIFASQDSYRARLQRGTLTADRNFTFPDASGTLALTSDIPSVPIGIYTAKTNDSGQAIIQCEKNTTIYVMDKRAYINIMVSGAYQYYSVTEIGKDSSVTWSFDNNTGVLTISGLRASTRFFYFKIAND